MDNLSIFFPLFILSPNCCYMSLTGKLELLHLLIFFFYFSLITLFELVLNMLDKYRNLSSCLCFAFVRQIYLLFQGELNCNFGQVWLYLVN